MLIIKLINNLLLIMIIVIISIRNQKTALKSASEPLNLSHLLSNLSSISFQNDETYNFEIGPVSLVYILKHFESTLLIFLKKFSLNVWYVI
jgi:hypothetical protein